ncbi:MAG: hypothetical protein ACOX5L_09305, partial [Bacteroidales bacterium]
MKKFIIFFLMAFLLLSNGHTFAEKSTHTLANKLTVDRIDHVDGVDGVAHDETIPLVTTPAGPVTITEGTTLTFSSTITPPPDRIDEWLVTRNHRQTRIIVNGVAGSYHEHNGTDQPASRSYTFDTPGTYTVQIEFRHRERRRNSWSQWSNHLSNTITVTVNAAFQPPVISGDNSVCQGNTTQLSTQEQPGYTYQWMIGSTPITGAINRTFDIPANLIPGDYNFYVRLMLGSEIKAVSAAHPVTVARRPTVAMPDGGDLYCDDLAFISISPEYYPNTGLTYQWYLGGDKIPGGAGGTAANLQNYEVPAQSDLYDFHVVATNTAAPNCSNDPVHKYIRVYDVPTFDIVPDVAHACVGGTVTLTHNLPEAEAANFAFQWLDAGGTAIEAATGESYSFTAVEGANTYQLRITHTTYDCSRTVPHTFNADAVPTVALSATEDICVGGYFELTATPTPAEAPHEGAYTYTWYRGGTALDGVSGPTFSDGPMVVGNYTYDVFVSTGNPGCTSTIASRTVVAHAHPDLYITGATLSCNGEVSLIVDPTNYHSGSSFVWYENGEELLGEQTNALSRTGLANGVYTYTVEVTAPAAQGGCVTIDEHTLEVYVVPAFDLVMTPDVTQACEGGQIDFTLSETFDPTLYDFEWEAYGGVVGDNSASYTFTMLPAGTTNVSVKVIHERTLCDRRDFETITLRAKPTWATPAITLNPDRPHICVGDELDLTAHINGTATDFTYAWTRNGGDIPGAGATVHHGATLPANAYTYSVVATEIAYPGCSVGDEIEINVHEKPEIYIAGNTLYCEVPANVILEAQGEHASSTYQ